jgi:hypothetical protein
VGVPCGCDGSADFSSASKLQSKPVHVRIDRACVIVLVWNHICKPCKRLLGVLAGSVSAISLTPCSPSLGLIMSFVCKGFTNAFVVLTSVLASGTPACPPAPPPGLKEEDMGKPQVGISSMWYEGNPCNMHLLSLAEHVKAGVVSTHMHTHAYAASAAGSSMGRSSCSTAEQRGPQQLSMPVGARLRAAELWQQSWQKVRGSRGSMGAVRH